MANLVDGDYPADPGDLPELKARREAMIREAARRAGPPGPRRGDRSLAEVDRQIAALPRPPRVYAGTVHHGSGPSAGRAPTAASPG